MQEPTILLTILGKMAEKPEVKFDQLFPKLYNVELWLKAYERIAPKPGNMTAGVDGRTVDGMGLVQIEQTITALKASRYKPSPVRRVYIKKANGKLRPLGIPNFCDKLLQTVVKFILEAIYEPTFSEASHGFRPHRSCHTALGRVKKMTGVRWWIEGDIVGFFDALSHDTLLEILSRRITDQRFLHLIEQFLRAGYIEDWQYHRSYSGTPQGGNLSPLLSNIYLNELDQRMVREIQEFERGQKRQGSREYWRICDRRKRAKRRARQTGDWRAYKELTQEMLRTPATEAQDPNFRRMYYCRYADDFLIGIIGSKAEAVAFKQWLTDYLKGELRLELSGAKTLITHVEKRVQFLGYEIKRGDSKRRARVRRSSGSSIQRTCPSKLRLLIPRDRCMAFAKRYGQVQGWQGQSRNELIRLSELEILMIYNTEIRGFAGYYALADNRVSVLSSLLWQTTTSFMKTLAAKHRSKIGKVAKWLKRGPSRYVIPHKRVDGTTKEYALITTTGQVKPQEVATERMDLKPNTWQYQGRTELGQRLRAQRCEWCGTEDGPIEVHHVRRLKDLQGKEEWQRQMIARQRKTMVLCKQCHVALHAGRLRKAKEPSENQRAEYAETCTFGSEGRPVRPGTATC